MGHIKSQIVLVCFGLLVTFSKAMAQDPVFSQFYNSPVYLNPALVGEEEFVFFNFAYRSQWGSLQFPYNTQQASLIVPYFADKHDKSSGQAGGIGVSLYADQAGQGYNLKSYGGNVSFAYNVKLSRANNNKLSLAIQTGFIRKDIDKNDLQWGEQYNPYIGFDNTVVPSNLDQIQNKSLLDITTGAFWRYQANDDAKLIRGVYAGFVAAHLNHPDESVLDGQTNRLPVLYKLHGGIIFALSDKTSISANFLSQQQDQVNQTNFGSFVSYKLPFAASGQLHSFIGRVGVWYRVQDSAIASAELLTNNFQLGFSYDWNVTSLRYNNRGAGSFEISVGYRFFQPAAPKVRY